MIDVATMGLLRKTGSGNPYTMDTNGDEQGAYPYSCAVCLSAKNVQA